MDEYEYPADDSRPVDETRTEKTDAVGERGNGDGRGGTSFEVAKGIPLERDVTVRSSSRSPNPYSSSSSSDDAHDLHFRGVLRRREGPLRGLSSNLSPQFSTGEPDPHSVPDDVQTAHCGRA